MLITSARVPTSLDADARNRRYLMSMAFRVACFLTACFCAWPWNVALFVAAALIPGFAVILANAIDKRGDLAGAPPTPEPSLAPALPASVVVRGHIEGDVL